MGDVGQWPRGQRDQPRARRSRFFRSLGHPVGSSTDEARFTGAPHPRKKRLRSYGWTPNGPSTPPSTRSANSKMLKALLTVYTSAAASLPRYFSVTGAAVWADAASRYALKIAHALFPNCWKNGVGSRIAMVALALFTRAL